MKLFKFSTSKPDVSDVTVITNVWKRAHLSEQLEHLVQQTKRPREIWIVQYENFQDVSRIIERYPVVKLIKSPLNLKYFGRFALAQFVETSYTWILDDDVIPSFNWLDHAQKMCDLKNSIVSSAGRIIPAGSFTPENAINYEYLQKYFIGDSNSSYSTNHCAEDTLVDWGCNSWIFRSDWIKNFWSMYPSTFESGEDIHFSASCKLLAGIPTIVPKQTGTDACGNLKRRYGFDEFASFKMKTFIDVRKKVLEKLINERQWVPIEWNNNTLE